jgi:peptide/nickel transport system permease protein
MGFTLVVSLIYVMVNLLVDVLYAFLDPQIRY